MFQEGAQKIIGFDFRASVIRLVSISQSIRLNRPYSYLVNVGHDRRAGRREQSTAGALPFLQTRGVADVLRLRRRLDHPLPQPHEGIRQQTEAGSIQLQDQAHVHSLREA